MSKKKTPTQVSEAKETIEEVVETTEEVVEVVEETPATEPIGSCVYLGPTILGVIQKGTIFSKPKEEVIKDIIGLDKYPLIASLIVSTDTLAEDRIKVKQPDNLLYVNYHKLAKGKK